MSWIPTRKKTSKKGKKEKKERKKKTRKKERFIRPRTSAKGRVHLEILHAVGAMNQLHNLLVVQRDDLTDGIAGEEGGDGQGRTTTKKKRISNLAVGGRLLQELAVLAPPFDWVVLQRAKDVQRRRRVASKQGLIVLREGNGKKNEHARAKSRKTKQKTKKKPKPRPPGQCFDTA